MYVTSSRALSERETILQSQFPFHWALLNKFLEFPAMHNVKKLATVNNIFRLFAIEPRTMPPFVD